MQGLWSSTDPIVEESPSVRRAIDPACVAPPGVAYFVRAMSRSKGLAWAEVDSSWTWIHLPSVCCRVLRSLRSGSGRTRLVVPCFVSNDVRVRAALLPAESPSKTSVIALPDAPLAMWRAACSST